ncbi:IS701 family transposase [Mesorhizobium sp. M2D.F.Ca.ET.233.01.1.1]|uniref:IS701 family transposase n=1 Tax=Mesorhizobium sp. M2D.F.Ca.ET.233.01.1.1 TaxID=2563943 RepID=UPI001093ADF3|nr:IS701 family transposase [Mesorhizobium sp. M2D.F.Ca.ET.233.01.1.1]TGP14708.1 IS701 family transposase [Mesorhizobium sp. M2D.F.Ca.ET.233.01.1.1]TGV66906.1 IS701 family transposase [Mesorhizobium sp. M2D.F.Ca.ET.160.01.1.1]
MGELLIFLVPCRAAKAGLLVVVESIETTLGIWDSSLREVKSRIRGLFPQERVATSAGLFLEGLLRDEHRKTGWMRAKAAGDPGPWRQQAILGRAKWDADALRDIVRKYALETLADSDAVLVIDETGFIKQGKTSCGVARQINGSTGKMANCQIGLFAAYVSRHGHAFIDRALYLPRAWTEDSARLARAHVPVGASFTTKSRMALDMIARTVAADVPLGWIAVDHVWGVDIEMALRRWCKGYVVGVSASHNFFLTRPAFSQQVETAEDIARSVHPSQWRSLPLQEGLQGSETWAYCPFADLDVAEYDNARSGLWTAGLLIRRDANHAFRYFSTWAPAGTEIETLFAVRQCCKIAEDGLGAAKSELGLEHNETRSWHGWHRHVSLVMLAYAMVQTVRHKTGHWPSGPVGRFMVASRRFDRLPRIPKRPKPGSLGASSITPWNDQSGECHRKPFLIKMPAKQ